VLKSVKLAAEYGGLMKDPWGNTKMALALEGKNNKRLGLNWNSALETGGVLVSEEVRLNIELQFYNNNFKVNKRKWQNHFL
jgi:polyisoprenoid-binding protein YceI